MQYQVKRNGNLLKSFDNESSAVRYFSQLRQKANQKGVTFEQTSKKFTAYVFNNQFVFSLSKCSIAMNTKK
jgi:hypothetical protein